VDINKTIESMWAIIKPQVATTIRGGLKVVAGMIGGWGAMKNPGSQEQFIDLGTAAALYLIGQGWSWWQASGEALVKAQVDIIQAKTLAQAQKLRLAGLPQVTVKEIAQQSPTMTLAETAKVIPTLPAEIRANIAPATPSQNGMGKIVAVIAILIGAMFLGGPDPASAQTAKLRAPQITGNVVEDAKANLGIAPAQPKLLTGNVEKDMHALWDKIVNASNDDLTYASALAASAATPASAVRKQCYDAILKLNAQVNGKNVLGADSKPLPMPDPKLFTGVEQAAETIDNLSPSGPLFVNCAGMAQLTKTNVLTLVNAIVTGAAGFAAMPIIPGL
jgi:hypothetical protein